MWSRGWSAGFLEVRVSFWWSFLRRTGEHEEVLLPEVHSANCFAAQKEGSGKEDGFGRDEYGRIRT